MKTDLPDGPGPTPYGLELRVVALSGAMSVMGGTVGIVISDATCGVLTAIFPIVLLTVVLERRTIHVNIRRMYWFRAVTQVAVVAAVGGLLLSVFGVQLGGYDWYVGWLVWTTFVVAVGCLTFNLIAAAASAEVEEDGPTESA